MVRYVKYVKPKTLFYYSYKENWLHIADLLNFKILLTGNDQHVCVEAKEDIRIYIQVQFYPVPGNLADDIVQALNYLSSIFVHMCGTLLLFWSFFDYTFPLKPLPFLSPSSRIKYKTNTNLVPT